MTQYQSIISELKGEIGRLKEKITSEPVGYFQNFNKIHTFVCEGRDIQHGHQAADGGTEDTKGCNGCQFQRANEASV